MKRVKTWLLAAAAAVLLLAVLIRFVGPGSGPKTPRPGPAGPEAEPDVLLPEVTDLEPADGAVLRGDRAWVRWRQWRCSCRSPTRWGRLAR